MPLLLVLALADQLGDIGRPGRLRACPRHDPCLYWIHLLRLQIPPPQEGCPERAYLQGQVRLLVPELGVLQGDCSRQHELLPLAQANLRRRDRLRWVLARAIGRSRRRLKHSALDLLHHAEADG